MTTKWQIEFAREVPCLMKEDDLRPSMRSEVTKYEAEADFFQQVLQDDLQRLPKGARVLEIGSGLGALSVRLVQMGFQVTSLEPELGGFSSMITLRQFAGILLSPAGQKVEWIDGDIQTVIERKAIYDYAIAVNVIEHVSEYERLIEEVVSLVKPGGTFRVICPNYAFPYEPHFHLPTLLVKSWSERALSRRISNSKRENPWLLWDQLSWPTARSVSRALRRIALPHEQTRDAFEWYLRRVFDDEVFAERKSGIFLALARRVAAHRNLLVAVWPRSLVPVLDFRVKPKDAEVPKSVRGGS